MQPRRSARAPVSWDFSRVEDLNNFVAVPNGTHPCVVHEMKRTAARDGSDRWWIRWVVTNESPWAGRTAAWDSLTWNERGMRRVKWVLGRLGFDVAGCIELAPNDLLGRKARVTVFAEEFINRATGARTMRSRVPFAGYEKIEE